MSNKNYIVLNADGKVVRQMLCNPKNKLDNVPDGGSLIEGFINTYNQKIVNGVIVNKTQQEIIAEEASKKVALSDRRKAGQRAIKDKLLPVYEKYPEVITLLVEIGSLPTEAIDVLQE